MSGGVRTSVSDVDLRIRIVLRDHAHLRGDAFELEEEASLFDAGMSSHASVSVLIALEDAFGIEFPDAMLTRDVFASVANLSAAVRELTASVG